jgi:hypothetical protein
MTISPVSLPKEALMTAEDRSGSLVRRDVLLTPGDRIHRVGARLVVKPRIGDLIEVTPERRMLADFAGLTGRSDDDVRDFARRWGMLGLCAHQLPRNHRGTVPAGLLDAAAVSVGTPCGIPGDEAISAWRYWSSQALALLQVFGPVVAGGLADERHWQTLASRGPWATAIRGRQVDEQDVEWNYWLRPGSVATEPILVTDAVDAWLSMSGERLSLSWWDGQPQVRLGQGGLLGALGMQLVLAATGADALGICSGCRRPHVPSRPRATQWRSYCPECRRNGVPVVTASATYRRLEKEHPNRVKQLKGRRKQLLAAPALAAGHDL